MKPFDWILIVIASLWLIFNLLVLWAHLGSPEVKYLGAKITINWKFFIPVFLLLFVAWRVGG